jgi:hypothetical protein
MKPMPISQTTAASGQSIFLRRTQALAILAPALLLAACTSVPLPPWTPPAPSAPAPAVQTFPVAPPTAIAPTPIDQPAPYSAAVAARFPAPSVVYDTPGLQAGRTSFTTQGEIDAWLRDQAAAASRSPGVSAAILPIGQSQRGEPLQALVLTRATGTNPASSTATSRRAAKRCW